MIMCGTAYVGSGHSTMKIIHPKNKTSLVYIGLHTIPKLSIPALIHGCSESTLYLCWIIIVFLLVDL